MDVISPTGVMTNGRMNPVMLRAFLGVWSDGGIQIRCRGEGPARNSARPRPRPGSLRRERPIRLNRTHWEGGRRFSIPFADSPDDSPLPRLPRSGASTRRSNAKPESCSPASSNPKARRRPPGPNTRSTAASPQRRASTGPGTTGPDPRCTGSWTRPWACSPTTPTHTRPGSAPATRTATA